MTDEMLKDLGRKCGEDVSGAIRRNIHLADSTRGAVVIASYGAVDALGAFSGVLAAYMGHDEGLTPEFVDEMWSTFLRPLMISKVGGAS